MGLLPPAALGMRCTIEMAIWFGQRPHCSMVSKSMPMRSSNSSESQVKCDGSNASTPEVVCTLKVAAAARSSGCLSGGRGSPGSASWLVGHGVSASASNLNHKAFQTLKSASTMACCEASLTPEQRVMTSGFSSVRRMYA